jgi:hypothetical protein
MMWTFCRGVSFMVYMEHSNCFEEKCSIIFLGNLLDDIVKQSVIT